MTGLLALALALLVPLVEAAAIRPRATAAPNDDATPVLQFPRYPPVPGLPPETPDPLPSSMQMRAQVRRAPGPARPGLA